jgi:transcriptional regulator with XRE-family HTH domain
MPYKFGYCVVRRRKCLYSPGPLREARLRYHLTQQRLADALHVNWRTIAGIELAEYGKRGSRKLIKRVAAYLRVPLEELNLHWADDDLNEN